MRILCLGSPLLRSGQHNHRIILSSSEGNLVDSPEVWNRVAREDNDGNIDLIDNELRHASPVDLKHAYEQAAAPALTALKSLNTWLEQTLAKHPRDWRLGEDLYAKKFRYTLETDARPELRPAAAEADLTGDRGTGTRGCGQPSCNTCELHGRCAADACISHRIRA